MEDTFQNEAFRTRCPISPSSARSARPAIEVFSPAQESAFRTEGASVLYGASLVLSRVSLAICPREITAFIGPSGCGKSTFLQCFNRTNDLIPSAHMEGSIYCPEQDLYGRAVDAVEVRRRIGMVFQKPNPFPKSIYGNVVFGPKVTGRKVNHDTAADKPLRRAGLWEEVKSKLCTNTHNLSGGQQQRLCIARALAVEPEVILMDEPCSALDPVATRAIEELMSEPKKDYTLVIVTHNMQQAARISDRTAFFAAEVSPQSGALYEKLVEYGPTDLVFSHPVEKRTEGCIPGRFG